MNFLNWLGRRSSDRDEALSRYRRGMVKAKHHDHQGSIDEYTKALGVANLPADVKAMVLYNRALVFVARGDDRKGAEDLDAILAMDKAPTNVKTMARQKLARMESRSQ